MYIISTTDFFFPLVDSPYIQGRIGAANVLSDLYSTGVYECDYVLMLLASCLKMSETDRTVCTREMIRGFKDACTIAETTVTGGQTVLNPWPIIGGVATSVVHTNDFIRSVHAVDGDVVVLTKPLGTQVAVNVHQWKNENNNTYWNQCLEQNILTVEEAETMMHDAILSMIRLNRNAAKLLLKYNAHACTDVTGFGILGHAQNLMENQLNSTLVMKIHTLPCIAKTVAVNEHVLNFQLANGYSAETSGGLLICMSPKDANQFCIELEQLDRCPAWIIGTIVSTKTTNTCTSTTKDTATEHGTVEESRQRKRVELCPDLQIIEVRSSYS